MISVWIRSQEVSALKSDENMSVCVCTVHSFHAPLARAVLWTPIIHPPLCSNDYWLLIDSFMRCELLWLVSYRRVHMKIWSVWFMSSFWFYWGAQWTAAAGWEQRKTSSFQSKSSFLSFVSLPKSQNKVQTLGAVVEFPCFHLLTWWIFYIICKLSKVVWLWSFSDIWKYFTWSCNRKLYMLQYNQQLHHIETLRGSNGHEGSVRRKKACRPALSHVSWYTNIFILDLSSSPLTAFSVVSSSSVTFTFSIIMFP